MNILEILKNNPELAPYLSVTAKVPDLMEVFNMCLEARQKERQEPEKKEKVLTADEVCEMFQISQVTLWSWDGKKITNPVYIGKRKYYKQSDIDKLLCKA